MGVSVEKKSRSRNISESQILNSSTINVSSSPGSSDITSLRKSMKLPNTSVNEAKLKVILKQLKKM
jgi:hypothetical protein